MAAVRLKHIAGCRMQAVKRLTESQARRIVREKRKGELTNADIASSMNVSESCVQKIARRHKNAKLADIKHPRPMGRPASSLPGRRDHSSVLCAKGRYKHGARKMEKVIERNTGIHMPHNDIHRVLRDEELAERNPKKSRRRKWVRYERRFSNSMWHTDYALLSDGRWFLAYMDDASRFITGYGVFDKATGANALKVLRDAMARHGKPASILTDRGTQFYANEAECRKRGETEFEKELVKLEIRHILARVNHPQTNGKLERFHRELKRHLPSFEEEASLSGAGRGGSIGGPFHAGGPRDAVEMLVDWYNNDRSHESLDVDAGETPVMAFARKIAPEGIDVDAAEAEHAAR